MTQSETPIQSQHLHLHLHQHGSSTCKAKTLIQNHTIEKFEPLKLGGKVFGFLGDVSSCNVLVNFRAMSNEVEPWLQFQCNQMHWA